MPPVGPTSQSNSVSRFRLLRLLGQGAQGMVYLAYDPQLDRQVAIKTLLLEAQHDPGQAEHLLESARTASSLSHPNIVPVFEVGIHRSQPFVVFEYVEGRTLGAVLHAEGPLAMARAVVMMSQILAGVSHVHASGLLHGDIKPANILIGANGIPRVTDFGISRRALAAAGETVTSGTVQYMAPECLDRGSSDYRSDVFALGLVFHEMLTGKPVYEASNEYAQIYRILNETPAPPSNTIPRIDKRIDYVVLKALQRDPAHRYADAGEMKRELDRYRVPAASAPAAELKEQSVHSTVEFLLRRMALKSDFPALTASFNRINQLCARADEGSLKAISGLVMRDFALTQKLLRVVNAAEFGSGGITKVSQAVALLGMTRLRAVATGMMLAAGGRSGRDCPAVAAVLTDAFIAGVIARNIGRMLGLNVAEELFICGMFSRLGELLVLHYLRDEHEAIERRSSDERIDPGSASSAVLGLSFDQLGVEVAGHWNFPEGIVQAMYPLPPEPLSAPRTLSERMWHCAAYARELCALAREASAPGREAALAAHLARFAAAVPVPDPQVRALIVHSVDAALKYVAASDLRLTQTALLDGLGELGHMPTAGFAGTPPASRSTLHDGAEETSAASAAAAGTPPSEAATGGHGQGIGARLAKAWRALF